MRVRGALAIAMLPMAIGCASDEPKNDAPIDAAPDTNPSDASDAGPVDAGEPPSPCASPRSAPVTIEADLIANTTWTCDHVYLVKGTIKVVPPTVLTIEAGTTVLMSNDALDSANLVIGPGARLEAVGTRDLPIVFTSSAVGQGAAPKPGDWGCVALVGLARGNWGSSGGVATTTGSPDDANEFPDQSFPYKAGSTDASHDADSSGTLRYVRMEYGGSVRNARGSSNHEMFGVYGVGSGTLLEYVNFRQALFGCLFAQGGSFRARHMICQYGGQSGGFDFSRGNSSRAQFLLVQENPNLSSEGIGYKGAGDSNQLQPFTNPVLYNVTACGTNGGIDPKDPHGFFMRRAPAGVLANFIATGYRGGLAMTGGPGQPGGGNLVATAQMRSSILYGNFDPTVTANTNIYDPYSVTSDTDLNVWFYTQGWLNSTTSQQGNIPDCYDANTMRAAPTKSITDNAETPPDDGFFDPNAKYIGAFRDANDDWTIGKWVKWTDL